jgi:hypothetical protein
LAAPPIGAYLKGALEPSLLPFHHYHQFLFVDQADGRLERVKTAVSYEALSDIEGAVYNEDGVMVLSSSAYRRLQTTPSIPVTAIKLVRELVDEFLQRCQLWGGDLPSREYEIVFKYLNSQAAPDFQRSDDLDLVEDILVQLSPLRGPIAFFVGEDEWCVHYTKALDPRTVVVHKSIDYRIADWTERMVSGEWKKK